LLIDEPRRSEPSGGCAAARSASVPCCNGHRCDDRAFGPGHYCNVCRRNIRKGSRGLRCERCDWDVCAQCAGAPPAAARGDGLPQLPEFEANAGAGGVGEAGEEERDLAQLLQVRTARCSFELCTAFP
jgi:hypothetical protein